MKKEEQAIALEHLKKGYKNDYKNEPIVQGIGTKYFTLLELVPKEDKKISLGEKIYIGKDDREKIEYIKSTLEYKDLTTTAKNELENVAKTLVEENEEKFIKFFNTTGAITIKEHSLELLPGIGKKHMEKILDQRRKEEFKSYEDLEERVELMPDPKESLAKRLIEEIKGNTKYRLFTKSKDKKSKKRRKR